MAVGKNFLENLTVAMYENSFTVYREFVQNAADSIDKAIASKLAEPDDFYIDISIEYSKRRICVYDNACGIPIHLFKKRMLDVADSDKDRDTEKGFRGIGRLAGLGYCDKLIFRTTSKGEDKESIITWDGVKLKEIVDDPTQHPSSEELINTITVNGNQLFKPYKTNLLEGTSDNSKPYDEIKDVAFKIFKGNDGKPIAWMWYGIAKFEKQIPVVNEMRCIRLRKENIQIGDESTIGYPKYFKEQRGNSYFIGEVFAVDNGLIPNARRDYFNQNPATKQFEKVLKPFFNSELYNLYHYASKVRSAQKTVSNFQKKEEEYKEKLNNAGFIDTEERETAQKELEEERAKSLKAQREIENRRKDADENEVLNRVFNEIEKTYKHSDSQEEPTQKKKNGSGKGEKGNKYLTQSLSKYGKKEQKLIAKIYNIIKMILPKDYSEMVIKKIQEELSK